MKWKGKEIFLKFVEESDAQPLLELEVRNKDFFQPFAGLRDKSFYTLEGQLERVKKAIESRKNGNGYSFLIGLQQSGEIIGEITLSEVVRENLQSGWVGYSMDQAHNGKGYTTEAVKLVVKYAFEELGLHRIEAGVMPHNLGSMRVLLKAGFHKEGIARENVKVNGQWQDHQTLAIVNNPSMEKERLKVERKNPSNVAPPLGSYTHLAIVPKGADLFVLSGQVGTESHGELPPEQNLQIKNTLQNIRSILEGESISVENIFKINILATENMDWKYFNEAWDHFHGGNPPAMTFTYVPSLAKASLKIEIEVWAARW